jgi:hypothetical protein
MAGTVRAIAALFTNLSDRKRRMKAARARVAAAPARETEVTAC